MKKIFFFLLSVCFCMVSVSMSAHCKGEDWHQKIKTEKIAFLSSEMDLTPEEAQVFWPVYNQAEKAKMAAMKSVRESYMKLEKAIEEAKEESEVKSLLLDYIKASSQPSEVDAANVDAYLKVLPADKVSKLILGEEKFRRVQFMKLQNRRAPESQPKR